MRIVKRKQTKAARALRKRYHADQAHADKLRERVRRYQLHKYQTDPEYREKRCTEYVFRYHAGLTGRAPTDPA